MKRYTALQTKLLKGLDLKGETTSSNTLIRGWTPNNLRRLIISGEWVIVQYHVKDGKFTHKTERFNLKHALQEDIGLMQMIAYQQTKVKEVKPITRVLTDGRVYSCLEEIIFVTDNYPELLLKNDVQYIQKAIKDSSFKRLMYIGVYKGSMRDIEAFLQEQNGYHKELLTESVAVAPNVDILYTGDKMDYWKHLPLRPQYYEMDKEADGESIKGVLRTHLERVRDREDDKLNAIKTKMYTEERVKEQLQEALPVFRETYTYIKELLSEQVDMYGHLAEMLQLIWGYPSEPKYIKAIFSAHISRHAHYEKFRRIDVEGVLQCVASCDEIDKYIIQEACRLQELFVKNTVKRDVLDIEESIAVLKRFMQFLLSMCYNHVYTTYAVLLTNNAARFAPRYKAYVKFAPDEMLYDASIIEYFHKTMEFIRVLNKNISDYTGRASEGFKLCGYEYSQTKLPARIKIEQAKEILVALKKYNYMKEKVVKNEFFE